MFVRFDTNDGAIAVNVDYITHVRPQRNTVGTRVFVRGSERAGSHVFDVNESFEKVMEKINAAKS